MRKIKSTDAKRIEESFIKIGFIPRKIPNANLKYYGDWDFDEDAPRQELNYFVNQPIVVENEKNGDVYQVYYKDYMRSYMFDKVFQNENEALKINNHIHSDYFYSELVKKGATFGLTSETIDSSDLAYSEFAKFDKIIIGTHVRFSTFDKRNRY